ncbi:hypothetical protein RRG08_051460 [Elysia crispata]|uniref:Uncharacterized protein n=1 Tax=Elysia crispata TaxID=231223 RepID=A0AAE0XV17_9GAST|nr:hypothetical protein RRG08_051460 [Elysia crispata]
MLIMHCALVYQSKQQLITAACISKPKVPTHCALVYQSKQQLITAACISKPKVPTHCALVYQSKQQLITAASISKPKVPTHCVRLLTIGKVRNRSEMKGDANTFFGDCHGRGFIFSFPKAPSPRL